MSERLPIVQYWHSVEPPDYICELTRSFTRRNPDRPHIVFNAQTAERFIAEHFTGREVAAFRACGPPAMQADYLRYCALLHFGGIWSDAGFICVQDMAGLLTDSPGGELFRSFVSSSLLMNGFFAFAAPGHPFLRLTVDLSTTLIERRWKGKISQITGPFVITAIYDLHQAESIDIFLREAKRAEEGIRDLDVERYARLVCEVVEDHERAIEAGKGLRVHPADDRHQWVRPRPGGLPHRSEQSHWSRPGAEVYAPLSQPRSAGGTR